MNSAIGKQMGCVLLTLALFGFSGPAAGLEQEAEKTYDISLVKTAEVDREIRHVGDQKVLTETVTVENGDWIWKILRRKGLLTEKNFPQLLAILKRLNTSLESLDMVHPGDQVIIPLKIAPVAGDGAVQTAPVEETVSLEDLEDLEMEKYTVKAGDSIIKVVTGKYEIPPDHLYGDYLRLVKQLNPSIEDLDTIHPGQVVRLPIYSPQVVRKPIPPSPVQTKADTEGGPLSTEALAKDLRWIFQQLGEEWIQSGKHFIPLQSGGQIDLQAETFPILSLTNGVRVIVDLRNELPPEMGRLIESNWESYRVVTLVEQDDLRSALDKIVVACSYPQVLRAGDPLEWGGDMFLKITADWIIRLSQGEGGDGVTIAAVYLSQTEAGVVPETIQDYLRELGVKVIQFPPGDTSTQDGPPVQRLVAGGSPEALLEELLNVTGHPFSRGVEIPVFQSQKDDVRLRITADFFLQVKGRESIITIRDLGEEVIALLRKNGFGVLSLANQTDPSVVAEKTLAFLSVAHDSGSHTFTVLKGDPSRNIQLAIPGTVFTSADGRVILATPLDLPDGIAGFLAQKGYETLLLSPFGASTS